MFPMIWVMFSIHTVVKEGSPVAATLRSLSVRVVQTGYEGLETEDIVDKGRSDAGICVCLDNAAYNVASMPSKSRMKHCLVA